MKYSFNKKTWVSDRARTGEVRWSGLQKAMKFIFQISVLPILWISNISYDVNIMKSLGLLSAPFWEMETIELQHG